MKPHALLIALIASMPAGAWALEPAPSPRPAPTQAPNGNRETGAGSASLGISSGVQVSHSEGDSGTQWGVRPDLRAHLDGIIVQQNIYTDLGLQLAAPIPGYTTAGAQPTDSVTLRFLGGWSRGATGCNLNVAGGATARFTEGFSGESLNGSQVDYARAEVGMLCTGEKYTVLVAPVASAGVTMEQTMRQFVRAGGIVRVFLDDRFVGTAEVLASAEPGGNHDHGVEGSLAMDVTVARDVIGIAGEKGGADLAVGVDARVSQRTVSGISEAGHRTDTGVTGIFRASIGF